MESYEQSIMESLDGDTPKEKWESLLKLKAKISGFQTFLKGMQETPDEATIKHIRSFINAQQI